MDSGKAIALDKRTADNELAHDQNRLTGKHVHSAAAIVSTTRSIIQQAELTSGR